ncbi:MAG TPA: SgcJ/EcaC family oxidoreductase [Candidatus Acidoferrales bacterium]|nr:SgcJ/EcaC family oxidoreductase [Candidatus Acidoferrales bacterium]
MSEVARPNPGQEIGDQVARLRQMWADAFNQQDAEELVSFYAEDAVMLPPNAPAAIGSAAIRELVKRMFSAGVYDLRITQKQVEYTGPLAVEIATYTLKIHTGQNGVRNESGRLVTTWRRAANGEFQITISVWSASADA